jgi:hypothetical protein
MSNDEQSHAEKGLLTIAFRSALPFHRGICDRNQCNLMIEQYIGIQWQLQFMMPPPCEPEGR